MISLKQNVTVYVALGAGLALAAAASWWQYRQNQYPPKTWRKVGELSDLWCYPIKSCGPVSLNGAECVVLGVKNNMMRDRVFMVTGLDKNFKTARTFPHMTQIMPTINGNVLTLKAPAMEDISVDISCLPQNENIQATVWDQPIIATDCGDKIAVWLSQYILKEDTGCRLMYYPMEESKRTVRPKNAFSKLTSKDSGAFPDASSYMIINEASVRDLRGKLPKMSPCTPLHFRPNFVATGSELKPYEEDQWKWVRIGDQAIFQCAKPCTRCIFTNIDPTSGIPNKNHEPLKTLKTYRQVLDPALRPFTGDSPVLGVHLALHTQGNVQIGDPIFVSM